MTARTIALIASSYAPRIGGVETHVAAVAKELSRHGDSVEVWTVDRGEHLGDRVVDGIRVRYLPTPLPARTVSAAARFVAHAPLAWTAWSRAYRALRPDLLHVHCFGPNGVYALGLHLRFRVPLVVTSHGETLADDGGAYRRSLLLRRSLSRAIAAAAATTAPSGFVLDDLRRSYGLTGGTVVPNGVELDVSAVEPAVTGRYLAAVGRLGRMKGFDLLLDAFAEARLAPELRLVIGGDGPERGVLLAHAERLGISDRVVFAGRLSPEQVTGLMAGAIAVVVPSRVEAFGIVALESWRARTPLVMTNRGGAAEFITDGEDGILVDPEQTAELSGALERIVDDDALRARLAARGRTRVTQFTWSSVAEDYRGVYESATRRARRR